MVIIYGGGGSLVRVTQVGFGRHPGRVRPGVSRSLSGGPLRVNMAQGVGECRQNPMDQGVTELNLSERKMREAKFQCKPSEREGELSILRPRGVVAY